MFSATNQVKQLKISIFRVFALWVGYFGQKKHFFLFLIQIGPNHSEMVPNGQKLSDTTFGPIGTVSGSFTRFDSLLFLSTKRLQGLLENVMKLLK